MVVKEESLGFALVPDRGTQNQIYALANQLADLKIPFSWRLDSERSVPHVSIFQGVFKSEEEVLGKVRQLNVPSEIKAAKVLGLSLWAEKIVFLDIERTDKLQVFHEEVFDGFFPLASGESADPQDFKGITSGQRDSFSRTGYPFSNAEFLPHFTIAHVDLKTIGACEANALIEAGKSILEAADLSDSITFERFVVFVVGKLGSFKKVLFERKL